MSTPFDSPYAHGFVRVASAVPHVRVGNPAFNAGRTLALAADADRAQVALVIFPELGLAGYSSEDLFHQAALLDEVSAGLQQIVQASQGLRPVIVVGAPLRVEGGLFNTAVVVHRGRILGAVPKSFVPEYREFYEKRQFRAARDVVGNQISLLGETVPFGPDLIFACREISDFVVHVEICEDLWAAIPPSTDGALAGATVLSNLSASNITVAKASYRHTLCESQSARTISAYLYTAAGIGESTTDLAWDGQAMIYENGQLLAESERFAEDEQLLVSDVDLDRLQEVIRNAVGNHPDREIIIDMMNSGAHFFVKPMGDDLELSVGYFDNPALNPPDAPHGYTQALGPIPLELVLRRPQG